MMMITRGGNVGIGTTSISNAKLKVAGGGVDIESSTDSLRLRFYEGTTFRSGVQHVLNTGEMISGSAVGDLAVRANAGNMLFATGGSAERMRIASNGNVGIGTTSPNQKLEIRDTAPFLRITSTLNDDVNYGGREYGGIEWYTEEDYGNAPVVTAYVKSIHTRAGANHSNADAGLVFGTSLISSDATATERMRIESMTGNVGIGTTSPGAKLAVNSTGTSATPVISLTNTSSSAFNHTINAFAPNLTAGENNIFIIGKEGNSKNAGYIGYTWNADADNSNVLTFGHWASDNLMNLTGDGKLGIGTTSPSHKLDVNGDIALKGTSVFNLNSAALTIGDTAGTDSVTTLKLTTAGDSTTVYLDDSGNVGVNTTTPSYNLTVDSGTNDIGILTASSDSGSYVGFLDNSTSVIPKIGAVGNKLILDASQYVGVRRTDPSYALDVSGTIRATGDVIAYSDARVKENVETIPNALDKVKSMRGVGYNKIGEEKRSIGVIAQEMLEVMPEVVSQDEQGMYSVAYGNLVGVLIEAMKEQQAQIDELKAQLDGIAK
jgi:hypothetical protein